MNPQDPLAALHPLREPAIVGWWPPAPGWWLLGILLLAGLAVCVFLLWRHHRKNAYRRLAQRQLSIIRETYQREGDARRCVVEVNALLKSVALIAYPRRKVASAYGDTWLALINEPLPAEQRLDQAYLAALYAARQDDLSIEQVLTAARLWIAGHRGQTA